MKSILQELYRGTLFPEETAFPKNDPVYRRKMRQMTERTEQLEKRLSRGDRRRLDKLLDTYADISTIEAEEAFIVGYKLGAMLMIQVFGD